MKKVEDIAKLMQAGAHIEMSSARKSAPDLVELAKVASRSKVNLVISGAKKMDDLVEIVKAGRGRVTIKF